VVSCPHCGFHYLASAARPLDGDRTRILLAEDQIFFRDLIREALGENYAYLVASSVEEARSILTSTTLNMVILDLNLEEAGDGEQILDATPQGTPVLVLTGDQDPDLFGARWEELQTRGATDLLLKGINIRDQIALKVNNILGRSSET
jgi:DNA-binding NtrC family response regulator